MANGFEVHRSMRNFDRSCALVEMDELVCAENKSLILSFSRCGLPRALVVLELSSVCMAFAIFHVGWKSLLTRRLKMT